MQRVDAVRARTVLVEAVLGDGAVGLALEEHAERLLLVGADLGYKRTFWMRPLTKTLPRSSSWMARLAGSPVTIEGLSRSYMYSL